MEKYFYSEGFIYLNEKIICELYGTDIEKEEQGILICKLLNNEVFGEKYKIYK